MIKHKPSQVKSLGRPLARIRTTGKRGLTRSKAETRKHIMTNKTSADYPAILAEITGTPIEDITPESFKHCGLEVFDVDGAEYAIGTDDECDKAAAENIKETVFAFQGWFIADHAPKGLSGEDIDALRGDKCEDINDAMTALVEAGKGMEAFIDAAICADGRGHFISQYDGEELEDEKANHFAYRMN